MSIFLFIDESGIDQNESPYEVLAGVSVDARRLWDLIVAIGKAEESYFGQRISEGALELKGKKLLKRKTFRLAEQMPQFGASARKRRTRDCLEKGKQGLPPTRDELTALAQTKVAFVKRALTLCAEYRVHAFASIVPRDAPRPESSFLRKDYSYLFERFFYFLENEHPREVGVVVFDELERSRCHILHDQMSLYFKDTATGMQRAMRILPEPFFVHSELTTAVQLADLVAYLIVWGLRFGPMNEPRRKELEALVRLVEDLRYRTTREDRSGDTWTIWSFTYIPNLRPETERT
ncbi:MAG: DUF3800 domain-containing protein [Acidobacteria bacterium]|nr:DUF3800 domain-containing protein [Acidobacteriota bacterium]